MNLPFSRTPTGIVGKWRFYPIPTIWVEGPTDIYFYEPIVADLGCRIEPFHGADNARALIADLAANAFPYAVVLDGDYLILEKNKQHRHTNIIYLERYSFENYLWEKTTINKACLRHAQCGEAVDVIGSEFDRITEHLQQALYDLVIFDVAARQADPSPKILPDRIESLLRNDTIEIDEVKASVIAKSAQSLLDKKTCQTAHAKVLEFVNDKRFVDVLKGHLLFGVLRRLFTKAVTQIKGKKMILNDEALMQILAELVWRKSPSSDHTRLKRKMKSTVRRLKNEFP